MASLLHRLGRWCARHHWLTIAVWAAVIAVVAGSATTLSKPLTTDFSIPGSRFEMVLADLQEAIPEAAGASATVVFTSEGGFDETEREAIERTLQDWRDLAGIAEVAGPFQTQEQLDAGADQLSSARAELAAGQAELDAGREELSAGRDQLEAARDQLPDDTVAGFEEQIAQAQAELDAGQTELDAGAEQLEVGERLAAMSDGLRFVSEDGTVALSQLRFVADGGSLDPELTALVPQIGEQLRGTGVEVSYSQEIVQDLSAIFGPGEIVGLVVAAVVLLVMLGSLLTAGLPLLMALVGVGVGIGAALALTSVVEMNDTAPALALMLGLAVGIDYSLFLINRHRTQVTAGMPVQASIALATGTSGNAVAFAGATVVIALAALAVTGIPFLTIMGMVAAGTVVVSVLVALTLTPAVLSVMGTRVLSRRERSALAAGHDTASPAPAVSGSTPTTRRAARRLQRGRRGWAATVLRHPVRTILGVLALVGFLAYPVTDLRLGLTDGSSEPPESTAYQTFDTVRDTFGAGVNGPIIAVATLDEALPVDDQGALTSAQADIGEDLAGLPGVQYVVPFGLSDDRQTIAFQVVPADGPSAESTTELVRLLDQRAGQIGAANDATLGFTGQTVANIDISTRLGDALPVYLGVVIGLSFLLLLLVFRSVVIPLLATGGFLLSLGAAFGAIVAVYQWGLLGSVLGVNEPGPILSFLPTLLIGVLFGLAMDYQLFLVSAMREARVHGEPAREAIVTGFNQSARVVVAAAVIMISVFGGFVFAELTMIRPIGMGLGIGVLVDAFVVRMTLTPAVMGLLGDTAWYLPAWLDRILPDVDVEGAGLQRHGVVASTSRAASQGAADAAAHRPPAPAGPRQDEPGRTQQAEEVSTRA